MIGGLPGVAEFDHPEMRALAERGHRREIASGRIDLRLGTAEHTGFASGEFDCVVAVNNVAIWPDLGAGLHELHKVTRPGGRLVIAWHGGTRPSRIDRGQRLPEHQLALVERKLSDQFAEVTRQELTTHTAFVAFR